MSIMKTAYRQTGGNVPFLPGRPAQAAIEDRLATGQPFTEVTGDYNTDLGNIIQWSADPRNVPQYYTGETVAAFDPLQEQAHRAGVDAAGQYDALTQELLGEYSAQLDPTSELNQRLATQAANAASWSGGPIGSARSQIAQQAAARQAVDANRAQALSGIQNQREALTGGAQILEDIGGARQARAQDVINEDIKRFNWAQLTPQQQQDRLISLLTAQAGLNQQEAETLANQSLFGGFLGQLQGLTGHTNSQFADHVLGIDPSGAGIFGSLGNIFGGSGSSGGGLGGAIGGIASGIGSALGGFFNEGGQVGPDGMPMDPMMQQDPMQPSHTPLSGAPEAQMMSGIMGAGAEMPTDMAPMAEPAGIMGMSMDMVSEEPMSAIDTIEAQAEAVAATMGDNVTITRKTKTKKSK